MRWGSRVTTFKSKFTHELQRLLQIRSNLSTAFHPQSDGQTERVNQSIEAYLRIFVSHKQDDWADHLPLLESAYNNSHHSSIGMTPFFANTGFHPRSTATVHSSNVPAAYARVKEIVDIQQTARNAMAQAQASQKRFYDIHRSPTPRFEEGDLVTIKTTNLKSAGRPSKKLTDKRAGPFRVVRPVGCGLAYQLELPASMSRHCNVFHVDLMDRYVANAIPGRLLPPPQVAAPLLPNPALPPPNPPGLAQAPAPPAAAPQAPQFEDPVNTYEVSAIINARTRRGKVEFLVDWVGYSPDDRSWQPAKDYLPTEQIIVDFYLANPDKPRPASFPPLP